MIVDGPDGGQPGDPLAAASQRRVQRDDGVTQRAGPEVGDQADHAGVGRRQLLQGVFERERLQRLGLVAVEDREARIQAGRERARAEHPRAEPVDRRDERTLGRARLLGRAELVQARPDPVAQLRGGLLGERDREDRGHRDPVLEHGPRESLDQHRGLAAAGAGVEQQVAAAPVDRSPLLLVEGVQGRHWLRQMPGKAQPSRDAGLRARGEDAAAQARRQRDRPRARVLEHRLELLALSPVPGDGAVADPAVGQEHPPRAQVVAPQRLVEAAGRLELGELADHQHVERDLELAIDAPARDRVFGSRRAALVVADHGGSVGGDIDPVDRAAHQHALAVGAQGQRRQRVALAGEPEPQLEPERPPPLAAVRFVLQISAQVGFDRSQGRLVDDRGPSDASLPAAPSPSAARARRAPVKQPVGGAERGRRQRAVELGASTRSSAACIRFPAGDRLGLGLERRGAQLALDQPFDRAVGVGLQRAGRQDLGVAQPAERRSPRLARGWAARRRRARRPPPAPLALARGRRPPGAQTTSASSRRRGALATGDQQLGDVGDERRGRARGCPPRRSCGS